MSAHRLHTFRNLLPLTLLWLGGLFTAPALADTTVPHYDPNGNITSRTTSLGTTDYTYDALDRLKTEFGPGVDQTFNYDGNGNRQSDSNNIYTIAPNGNRIQQINGVTLTYDPTGNLLDDGQGKTFTYNAAGRLKEVRVNNVLVASYKYNYQGLRTHKITPQGTTLYHYDPQGHLIQTTDPQGTPQQSLHWAGDQPIAQVDHTPGGDQLVYLHTDQLNTPRTATDQNQKIVWRWEGEAFGNTPPEENVDGDGNLTIVNLRYAGQYFDQETSEHYNWHRYYDPKTGRYITSDPIGLVGGLNTYSYVFNNPTRYFDTLGLDVTVCLYPGHIGLGVNSDNTVGRRPASSDDIIDAILGKNVPGKVSADTGSKLDCTKIKSTSDEDKKVQQFIDENTFSPGDYNLTQRSCVDLVRDPLRSILNIPLSNTNLPASLYGEIFRNNRRKNR